MRTHLILSVLTLLLLSSCKPAYVKKLEAIRDECSSAGYEIVGYSTAMNEPYIMFSQGVNLYYYDAKEATTGPIQVFPTNKDMTEYDYYYYGDDEIEVDSYRAGYKANIEWRVLAANYSDWHWHTITYPNGSLFGAALNLSGEDVEPTVVYVDVKNSTNSGMFNGHVNDDGQMKASVYIPTEVMEYLKGDNYLPKNYIRELSDETTLLSCVVNAGNDGLEEAGIYEISFDFHNYSKIYPEAINRAIWETIDRFYTIEPTSISEAYRINSFRAEDTYVGNWYLFKATASSANYTRDSGYYDWERRNKYCLNLNDKDYFCDLFSDDDAFTKLNYPERILFYARVADASPIELVDGKYVASYE